MATKTFKIGLSNTDKQNMAQDVYERLIAMCFDEYDSTKTYNEGDFVVYENPSDTFKLYKCNSDNVTGAWDSTKWDLATFQDLVDDIENAVAFVNDKANVDGNYPTMTVGVADQLSPYDDESGDDQSEPFNFQATGTGNGTQPDFATGSIALLKEKQGNTVVVNQLYNSANSVFTSANPVTTLSNGVFTINGTANDSKHIIQNNISLIANHKYLVIANVKNYSNDNTGSAIQLYGENVVNVEITTTNINKNGMNVMLATPTASGTANLRIRAQAGSTWSSCTMSFYTIDLTQWFNGDIPQDLLDHPENFYRYYQGSLAYNTGTLVNANGRYIKCIGRQQWDEEWEQGTLTWSTGENQESNSYIRSKNFIKVLPNTTYHVHTPNNWGGVILYGYDKDFNMVQPQISSSAQNEFNFTTNSNVCYVRFRTYNEITTYSGGTTISLYYEDESGYDQYYPYQVLTNNDTGTETLRSAGSVHDVKLPSGEITRKVGTYTFTGSESWTKAGDGFSNTFFWINLVNKNCGANGSRYVKTTNAISNLYPVILRDSVYTVAGVQGIVIESNSGDLVVYVCDSKYNEYTTSQFASAMAGLIVQFGLAEPTTEQGTPYSENLVIDDFGSMDFQGTNGVPQGNLIFYPVDYKAFIDTLYDYTEGTPSELVKQSERTSDKSAQATLDTALQNAIGGTLRQCLCVKETLDFDNTDFVDLGTLNWSWDSSNHLFYVSLPTAKKSSSNTTAFNGLCTKYLVTPLQGVTGTRLTGLAPSMEYLIVVDASYGENVTTFKNAMKGVLLAYEKAEE